MYFSCVPTTYRLLHPTQGFCVIVRELQRFGNKEFAKVDVEAERLSSLFSDSDEDEDIGIIVYPNFWRLLIWRRRPRRPDF